MRREQLEQELKRCAEYLQEHNIDIIFRQGDRELYHYYSQGVAKLTSPASGDRFENLRVCERFIEVSKLLSEMED